MASGTFFLVVGPSGVGKDTLIDGARARLADRADYHFATRVITRPADAGGERHEAADAEAFAQRAAAGEFLVTWSAHGLSYGLPANLLGTLAAGRHVVANGSRGTIGELAARVPGLVVVSISADRQALCARIGQRGRETPEEIARRLARKVEIARPPGVILREVANDASIEEGVARFLAAIGAAAG